MLRRQKQHHHSAEDEWLKVHRWAVAFFSSSHAERTPSQPAHPNRAVHARILRASGSPNTVPKPRSQAHMQYEAEDQSERYMMHDKSRSYVEELEKSQELDVLFYGDSIIEEWRWVLLFYELCPALDYSANMEPHPQKEWE